MTLPAPSPYFQLTEAATINAVRVLSPLLLAVPDEVGNAMTVPVRSVFSNDQAAFPEVVVSIQMGGVNFGLGRNILAIDDDDQLVLYGYLARHSKVVAHIKARSDAERHFIADTIITGITASYAVRPGGEVWEAAAADEFAANGIALRGFDPIQFGAPELGGPRPHGQIYPATISLIADIWVTWSTPGFAPTTITVQNTVSGPATGNPYPVVRDIVDNPLNV